MGGFDNEGSTATIIGEENSVCFVICRSPRWNVLITEYTEWEHLALFIEIIGEITWGWMWFLRFIVYTTSISRLYHHTFITSGSQMNPVIHLPNMTKCRRLQILFMVLWTAVFFYSISSVGSELTQLLCMRAGLQVWHKWNVLGFMGGNKTLQMCQEPFSKAEAEQRD